MDGAPTELALGFSLPPSETNEEIQLAREKNTARANARRRSRVVARESRLAQEAGLPADDGVDTATAEVAAKRPALFKFPNVLEDIRALPEMFQTKRTLWIPFAVLVAAFVVALGLPYNGVDSSIVSFLLLFFQMAFLPQGLVIYLVGGFLAPRAAYLVGFLLGLVNALLLIVFVFVRSDFFLDTAQGSANPAAAPGNVLPILIGYAVVIGPLAAAFAAWYRGFLNRMNDNSRARRAEREAEVARKKRDERRAAKRPVSPSTKTSA